MERPGEPTGERSDEVAADRLTAPRSGAADQVGRIRDFFRRSLLRREHGARAAEMNLDAFDAPSASAAAWSLAVAPVNGREVAVAFDLAALMRLGPMLKQAVLAPAALDCDLAGLGQEPAAIAQLALLQVALRRTSRVVVFDPAHIRSLALLGAGRIAAIPLPALAGPGASGNGAGAQAGVAGGCDVLVIVHEGERGLGQSVERALLAAMPTASIVCVDAASPSPAALPTRADRAIHLHVGLPGRGGGWRNRIVDSFATGCPVVHLLSDPAAATERHEPLVEHMRNGIVALNEAAAVAGVQRLVGDPALRDLFDRHADRAVERFNHRVDELLWGDAA